MTVVTSPGEDEELCSRLANEVDPTIEVLAPADIDAAIWIMANATMLVMSRSNFAMLGGMVNKNISYSYESWQHFDEVSGTKFGRSSDKFKVLKWK